MERKNLIYLSNIIYSYVSNLSYDQNIDFLAFKIDMEINLDKFLQPEKYEENLQALNNNEIQIGQSSKIRNIYLKKLIHDLKKIIINAETPYAKETINIFQKDQLELIDSISLFLNPDTYENNIKILNRHEKTKKLY